MTDQLLNYIKQVKALAEIGLHYANSGYDQERYTELHELSMQLLGTISGHDTAFLKINLPLPAEYPTAKVDIRGLILSPEGKILLVKESLDGKWSLPGGWADIGYTPTEVVRKECREETGLDVQVKQLLAVYDKKMHPHPYQPFYVYKMVFYCEAVSTEPKPGFDVQGVQYFPIDQLPVLSEDRILKSQLEQLYRQVTSGDEKTFCD